MIRGAVGQHPVERLDRRQHHERLAGAQADQMAAGRNAGICAPEGCAGAAEDRRDVSAVTARRVGDGEVFDEHAAAAEEAKLHFDVLDDLGAVRQVRVRRIDPGIDDCNPDAPAREAQFVLHAIGANRGDALVEEVAQLAVVIDGPDAWQRE